MNTITKLININHKYENARLPEVSMSYDIAVKTLEEQNELEFGSWHYNIRANENYHFYMDVDKYYGMSIQQLLDNVVDYFELQKTDIKISQNKFKDFSYHIDIPSIYGTPAAIHSHIKCLAEKYKWSNTKSKYQWDTCVYPEKDATRVYRMPHQSKPAANGKPFQAEAKHEIVRGQTIDFILDYYYDDARLLESFSPTFPTSLPSVKKQNVASCNDDDLSKIIDCLSVERSTDHTSWRDVGFALRNIEKELNDNLHHFLTFSEKGEVLYPKNEITKRYIGFTPKTPSEQAYRIGSLINWAKEDNMELYKQHFPTKCLLDDDKDNESEYNECISEGILNEAKKKLKQGEKIVFNDTHAGKHAFKLIRDKFKFCKGQLFVKTDNTWSMNIDILESQLRIQITDMGLKSIDRKGNLSNYCGNYSKCEAVRKCVMDYIYSNPDDKFYDLLHNTTICKICFNNGVYSFTEKRFDLWDSQYIKENPVYSCVKINRDYNPNISREVKDKVYKSVIEDVFGEHSEKYLHFLARATAGHITDKIWGLFLGSRDCGKGVNVTMTKSALGDYIGEFESNHLLCENFVSTDSKQNGWLIPYQFKRIMYSNELQKDSSGKKIKLNSKIIKSINSGGDQIEARALYGNETQISLQTSMMLMANDVPGASNNDVFEKCLEFKTTRQFKSKEYIQEKIKNSKSEIQRETYENNFREADTDIKNKAKTQEWADAFIQLIIESYKDVSVFVCNNDEDNGEESICDAIFNLLNITGNQDDFVSNADVKKVFSEMNVSIKVIKSNLLAIKSVKEGRDKSGKERGYRGIKLINSTTNLIDELDD
jgi:hypothetical protein